MRLKAPDDAFRVKAVLLDGEDVTNETTALDTEEGWVDYMIIDEKTSSHSIERRYGQVTVELIVPPLPADRERIMDVELDPTERDR